ITMLMPMPSIIPPTREPMTPAETPSQMTSARVIMREWQAWKDAPQHKADRPGPGMTRKTRRSTAERAEFAEKAIDGASREARSLDFSANSALSAVDLPYRRS